jgi:hypothetical protein
MNRKNFRLWAKFAVKTAFLQPRNPTLGCRKEKANPSRIGANQFDCRNLRRCVPHRLSKTCAAWLFIYFFEFSELINSEKILKLS